MPTPTASAVANGGNPSGADPGACRAVEQTEGIEAALARKGNDAAHDLGVTRLQARRQRDTVQEARHALDIAIDQVAEIVGDVEVGITVILGVVIYYMASQALAGREDWAIFIAYIGALRMTLNGGAQVVRLLASVSRYYPQIVRYVLFAKDMQKIGTTDFARVPHRREAHPRHSQQWAGCDRRSRRLPGGPLARLHPRGRVRLHQREDAAFHGTDRDILGRAH